MNASLTRLTARLAAPLLAVAGLIAAGEPLPEQVAPISVEQLVDESIVLALREEADALRADAEAARASAHASAARMRWFLTLPAVGSKRCSTPGCAS